MFKLKLNNKKIQCYKCPLSTLTMNKPCPINSCHAWIKNKHPSNCLFQFYFNKSEFDRYDLMYVLGCNDKKLREKQLLGKNQVYNGATLFNVLSRLRDNNKFTHCKECGVIRTTKNSCLNTVECKIRSDFACNAIKQGFLRFPEYKATKADVFLLLHNKEKIQQFITTTEQTKEWDSILGLNESLTKKANFIRTIV